MATASARGADDPVLLGAAEFARAQALYHIGAVRPSLNVCTRAANSIEAATDSTAVQQVYGTLHLHAAQTCAVSGNAEDARAHLAEATATARRAGEHIDRTVPDGNVFELYFGPANVELWRLAIAVEQHEGGRGPEIVAGVDQNALGSPNRRAYMYADLVGVLPRNAAAIGMLLRRCARRSASPRTWSGPPRWSVRRSTICSGGRAAARVAGT